MALVLASVYLPYGALLPERDEKIPLKSVEVHGEIIDFVGKIKIAQTFVNNYDTQESIEAKYMFNLDGNSTVTGLRMIIGQRILVGHVEEKSEARRTYETAISEKKTTSLLEKAQNGTYTMNVGNVLKDQEIRIEFEYLTTLECGENGEMKFVLPTNISPKYDDNKKTVVDLVVTKATTSNLVHSSDSIPFKFDLNLFWKSKNAIEEVKSFTNEIEVNDEHGGSVANAVRIRSQTAPSSGDFNVFVKTAPEPTVYVQTNGENAYMMVNHRIKDEYHEGEGGDYTIVVDRSGSMGDAFQQWSGGASGTNRTKMDYAREATELFVQSLPVGSKFNVIGFGSDYQPIFGNSVDYTDETKAAALGEIAKFDSNLGGTELYQCLSDVLSGQVKRGAASVVNVAKRTWTPNQAPHSAEQKSKERIVILMTDGDVGNVDSVTSLIRQYNHCCRVFTIGIGQDVNRFLVESLAKASFACSEVLIDNPDIATVVIKMMDASMKSYYKNIKLSCVGKSEAKHEVEDRFKVVYPNQFASFFYKMSTKDFQHCSSIELSCENGMTGQRVNWSFPINHAEDNSQENRTIAQLYAADLIRRLEKENNDNSKTVEIIKLSVEYGIMNERTSFVVVDEETDTTKASSNPVPVIVPQYSSQAPAVGGMFMAFSAPCPPPAPSFSFGAAAPPMPCARVAACSAPLAYDEEFVSESADVGCWDEEEVDEAEKQFDFEIPFDQETVCRKLSAVNEKKEMNFDDFEYEEVAEQQESLAPPVEPTPLSDTEKMDIILKYFSASGNIPWKEATNILSLLNWKESTIADYGKQFHLSEEIILNLLILKFLESDSLKSNKKYVLIIRRLQGWLKNQLLGKKIEDILSQITL
jgi:Ca-activated chloride channel family protein